MAIDAADAAGGLHDETVVLASADQILKTGEYAAAGEPAVGLGENPCSGLVGAGERVRAVTAVKAYARRGSESEQTGLFEADGVVAARPFKAKRLQAVHFVICLFVNQIGGCRAGG